MTDRDAMLRVIAANPDDDTPRLIYADLLDELGGDANTSRARFIRLQIDIYRDTRIPDDASYTAAMYRESYLTDADKQALARKQAEATQLANRYHSDWTSELPTWCNPLFGILGMTRANLFVRGFVERVTTRAKSFALRAPELFECHPIREIELQGGSAKLLPGVFDRPELAQLRSLTMNSPGLGGALTEAVAACPFLSELTFLDLSKCGLDVSAVRDLAGAQRLPNLRTIRLGGTLNVAVIRALAVSPTLRNLHEIDLRACKPWFDIESLFDQFPEMVFRAWYE